MKIRKARIQNFQCVKDSGDVALDDHMTILVGENESGKTAICTALQHLNSEYGFEDIDISTMSGDIRQRVDSGELPKSAVEMVAVWVEFSEKERRSLALPDQLGAVETFKIVKTLDNCYKVLMSDGEPLGTVVKPRGEELVAYLENL